MPLRFGEMVLAVRTQDFASRNLHRISGELGAMSRQQRALNRLQGAALRTDIAREKAFDLGKQRARLGFVRKLVDVEKRSLAIEKQLATLRTAPQPRVRGRFGSNAPQIASLTRELGFNRKAAEELDRVVNQLPGRYRRLRVDTASLTDAQIANSRAIRTNNIHLSENVAAQERAARAATARALSLGRLSAGFHALGRAARVSQLAGLALTAAFGFAAISAARFDTEVSLAASQARDIAAPLSQIAEKAVIIKKSILGMMQVFPASSKEMADAAFEILSSINLEHDGVMNLARGLNLLGKANKIAVAGSGSLEDATSALITIINDFDPQMQHLNQTLDTAFDIIRFGRMRIGEFNSMMSSVAPAAKNAGQSLQDVGGAMAYLTQVMPQPARAATGLSRLLEALRSEDTVKGLRAFGIEALRADGRLRPLPQLMRDIVKTFPGLKKGAITAENFFKTITRAGRGGKTQGREFTIFARRAFTFLTQGADEYIIRQGQVVRNTGELNKALKAQTETAGVQWDIFKNRMSAAARTIGTEAAPAFGKFGGLIHSVTQGFKNMDAGTRSSIIQFGVFFGIFSVGFGILGSLVGFLGSAYTGLATLAIGADRAAASAKALLILLRALTLIGAITIGIYFVIKKGTGSEWLDKKLGIGPAGRKVRQEASFQFIFSPEVAKLGNAGQTQLQARLRKQLFDNLHKASNKELAFVGQHLYLIEKSERKSWVQRIRAIQDFRKQRKAIAKGTFEDDLPGGIRAEDRSRGIKSLATQAAKLTKANKDGVLTAKQLADRMKKLFGVEDEATKKMKEHAKSVKDLAKWHRDLDDAMQQAADTAQGQLNSAAQKLTDTFKSLRDANQSAFGELFQGPWLTSQTFDLAKEWGITPQIEDMIKDVRQQSNKFTDWRRDLDSILKRGAPPELVEQLRELGPDALEQLEVIRKSAPGKFNEFVREWKRGQQQIQDATKIDFNKQLKQWKTYGANIIEAIDAGLSTKDQKLLNHFQNLISAAVPNWVAQARAQAAAEFKRDHEKPKIKPLPPKESGASGTTKPAAQKPTTVVNDNSTTYIRIPDAADAIANAKRIAFEMKQQKKRDRAKPSYTQEFSGAPRRF